ncbi:response regulator transcription factor [Sphingosinicella sp. BN140058]|uniref:response regulator transcription factor n=1 Tax=Sphingosinicella sp. BN140058 TaxID=1892855 RepID=UPI0010122890|nr:response regulator transcription factor [Sphingosinicella sp. BN140058]QAY78966.1 response regulator transcription factor [Sphingosinicella sp. BN140058]
MTGNVAAHEKPLVLVVDDDERVRLAISELMQSVGMEAICYGSTRELMEAQLLDRAGCLVLDVRMPGLSGLDLQHHLSTAGIATPIVFLTGYGDIPMSVQAMKAGAVDFLTKPFRDQTLLDAVSVAIERNAAERANARVVQEDLERFATLTPRECEVMGEVAQGRLNKQIAHDLGISEITVKLHRSNVMKKMRSGSVGELIRAWDRLPLEVRAKRPA